MKDKEKQIEEMAKIIADSCTIHKVYVNKHYPDRQKDMYYSLAEELLKYYQPKLPEDSVVLSRDAYQVMETKIEQLTKYAENERQLREYYCNEARKETAEKFVNETIKRKQTLMNPYTDDESECVSTYWIYKLAKQFGVKIKE